MSTLAIDDPWFLLLLPLAALGFWRLWRKRPTLRFSASARAKAAGPGLVRAFSWRWQGDGVGR